VHVYNERRPERTLPPATDNCSGRLRASQGLNVQSWASSSCCSSVQHVPSLTGDGYQAQESASAQTEAGRDGNGGADAQGGVLLLPVLAHLQPTPCPCCCQHSGVRMHMLLRLQTHACHLRIVSVDVMLLCRHGGRTTRRRSQTPRRRITCRAWASTPGEGHDRKGCQIKREPRWQGWAGRGARSHAWRGSKIEHRLH
jgi:hypothetical protein